MAAPFLPVAYLVAFAGTALACFGATYRALRITAPDVRRGLVALLLTSGLWAVGDLGLLLATPLAWKEALHIFGLVSGFATVWAWLYFCSAYAGRALHHSRAIGYLGALIFLVVVTLKVTNPIHGLYFQLESTTESFLHVRVEPRLLYWISNGLSYALAAGGYVLLLPTLRRAQTGRLALALLLGLAALPAVLNAIGSTTALLLNINHDAIGVALFAVGVLFVYDEYFEDVRQLGDYDQPSVIVDDEGEIRSYNAAAQDLFPRLRQPDGRGQPLEHVLPNVARTMHTGNELVRMPSSEGDAEREYQITQSRFGAGLRQPGRLLVFTDVTAREQQRRDQEAHLRGLIDSVPGVVFRLRAHRLPSSSPSSGSAPPDANEQPNAHISFISEAAGPILGLSPSSVPDLWKQFIERIPAPHVRPLLQSLDTAIQAGEPWRLETPYQHPDGKQRWILGTAAPEQHGDAALFSGVLLDITQRKEAENALQRSEERFRALSEQVVDIVAIFDASGQFEYLSPSVERVTGFRPDALVGTDAAKRVHPEDRPLLRVFCLEPLRNESKEMAEAELRFRHRDGSYRDLSIRAQRVTGLGGAFQVIASIRDVTDAKQRRLQLVAAKEEAEEASQLKSALLANMSHEVRTPLTSIIGFAEALAEMDLGATPGRFAGLIHQSGKRLMNTLNSVLNLSRLEAGAADIHPDRLHVLDLVQEVAHSFEADAHAAEVALRVQPEAASADASEPSAEDALSVRTDVEALRRILVNLVGNAIKFTGAGGRVVIRATAKSDHVAIAVDDDGIGMSPAFVERAFEAFRQESTGDAREYEGSGLGLAIVDRYAQLIGADLSIDSEKGVGTTVTVCLPRCAS